MEDNDIRLRYKRMKENEGYPMWDLQGHIIPDLGRIYDVDSFAGELYILGRVDTNGVWNYGLVSLGDGNGWAGGVSSPSEDPSIMFSYSKPKKANGRYSVIIRDGRITEFVKEGEE